MAECNYQGATSDSLVLDRLCFALPLAPGGQRWHGAKHRGLQVRTEVACAL